MTLETIRTNAGRRGEPAGANGGAVPRGMADWLCLAAAPTFAVMAVLAALSGGAGSDMAGMGAGAASPLTGMVTMYLLMSAFHIAPWLRLAAGRRRN